MANSEPTATQLKNEGNALYTRHDYVGAFAKYTKAIAVDGENAVLYANRSACNLEMKKYLDAAGDAHKVGNRLAYEEG
ncbi:hypothetical protein BV22DRAFT_77745 [Leucogyrophana mollusca]|uniref:Uncharacterized protein n=1 Tax=Leucogyrophana mollusca TaxID=85980 RepID=A0ACB8BZS2_9AGAM|nr:hypothetical protein BV22DRAFT_77745 [Leucogyrophana mollusca]